MVAAPPSGTVTFLFTDIEGSTQLWERDRDAMAAALELHDQLIVAAIEARGGYVFSTAGDSFAVAFPTATAALAAAHETQVSLRQARWPDGVHLRARVGVHTGEAVEREGNYFGPTVNRAARLMALAHGGQVLVSSAVEQITRQGLPPGLHLLDRGSHQLRGISQPETVFQLAGEGLAREFPALRSSRSAGNLPSLPSTFIGRVTELAELADRLRRHRLTSLVGPGGIGKTRLAIEAAAAAEARYPDGAWFIDLRPASDAAAVIDLAATTLGARPDPAQPLLEALVDSCARRRALLILDNCEHVLESAARLAEALSVGAPGISLLTTTRTALGLDGEHILPVGPLDPAGEAIELFGDRAAAVDPSFRIDDAARTRLAELCAALDGMPLALELAAGRVGTMTVEELAAGLADRFRLLRRSPSHGHDRRRQTLQATVEWSYQLLNSSEQLLFDRLSVFGGSFDRRAVLATSCDESLTRDDADDAIDRLVERSMVQSVKGPTSTRFRLLQTMRDYGHAQLVAREDGNAAAHAHLLYYLSVARRAQEIFEGPESLAGRALFELEWDNLRAAFEFGVGTKRIGEVEALLRCAFQYALFTHHREYFAWVERSSALDGATAASWGAASWGCSMDGRLDDAIARADRGLLAASDRDPAATWSSWFSKAVATFHGGDPQAATELLDRAIELRGVRDHERALSFGLAGFFNAAVQPNRVDDLLAGAREHALASGSGVISAFVEYFACRAAFTLGQRELSAQLSQRALALGIESGALVVESSAQMNLLLCTREDGSPEAQRIWRESLTSVYEFGNWTNIWTVLEALAADWAERGLLAEAGTIVDGLRHHGYASPSLAARRAQLDATLAEGPGGVVSGASSLKPSRDDVVAFALERLSQQDHSELDRLGGAGAPGL